jgi:AbrB family looped-hinge helix DNA binding protein
MAEVTLSTRNRIDIPLEAKEALGVRAGDTLLLVVKGDHLILMAKPVPWTKALLRIDQRFDKSRSQSAIWGCRA